MSTIHIPRISRNRSASGRLGALSPRRALAVIAAIHLVALTILYETEWNYLHGALALASWGFLNFTWLAILRRPALSAALSLVAIAAVIALSLFKFDVLWMGLSFFDVLIIDHDTISYLLAIVPKLRAAVLIGLVVAIPLLIALWRFDPFRIRRSLAALGAAGCVAALAALSAVAPQEVWESFQGVNHTSNFFRSGVTEASELLTHGLFAADAQAAPRLPAAATPACRPATKPPHIILLLDESSFDITAAPGIKVPPDYRRHFMSFDGAARSLLMEGTGGPTWYAEYNVLTGLSVRSFGKFQFYVTRIAADRVERGLPRALARCGYKTISLFPTSGAFLSARRFQETTGIAHFIDQDEMGARDDQLPDTFYLDYALRTIAQERGGAPLFMFAYVTANHFPWSTTYRPELTPDWQGLGNEPAVDEYLRRQAMSARDYRDFVERLKQDFPDDSFLIVRFGDHQPALSARILDPALDDTEIARRIAAYDPRYFTTYYAIDTVNFQPVDLSSARPRLDAAYLPLVLQEAAGLPLDASFAEQKKILERCRGLFYACADGREARRFNRLLIDAGLIKQL
jgi:Sulfatase